MLEWDAAAAAGVCDSEAPQEFRVGWLPWYSKLLRVLYVYARSMVYWSHFLRDVIDSTTCLHFIGTFDFKCFLVFVVSPVISLDLPHYISLVSPADSLAWLAKVKALPFFSWSDNIEASFEPAIIIVEHFIRCLYLSLAFDTFQFLFVTYWLWFLWAIWD